jgi:hypothetical protein
MVEDGDIWTWIATDADTKLCVGYLVGGRDGWWANEFMQDVASRIRGRVQLTADAHKAYLQAVENAFGADIDFATLQKIYGASDEPEKRYSPATCIGSDMKVVSGDPDPGARFHQFRGAPKSDDENVHAPVHTVDERRFKESGEPRRCRGVTLYPLQFRPDSQDSTDHSRDGGWYFRPCLEL